MKGNAHNPILCVFMAIDPLWFNCVSFSGEFELAAHAAKNWLGMSLRSQFRNISSQLLGNRSRYHLPVHLRRRPRMEMFFSRPARAAAAFLAVVVCISSAYSQERRGGERREIQRERFHTEHWVFDQRFNHNHYYPQFGYSVPVVPAGHIALTFRGNPFFFHSGVWYRRGGPGFVVVMPPAALILPALPPPPP